MSKPLSYPGLGKFSGKETEKTATTGLSFCACVLLTTAIIAPIEAQESNYNAPQTSNPEKHLSYLGRDTIEHEIDAQAKDESLWCYRKLEEKDGQRRLFIECQAKGAQIERLLAVNGRPLDEIQREAENQRIEKLI